MAFASFSLAILRGLTDLKTSAGLGGDGDLGRLPFDGFLLPLTALLGLGIALTVCSVFVADAFSRGETVILLCESGCLLPATTSFGPDSLVISVGHLTRGLAGDGTLKSIINRFGG